jgi:hypothetical protein
MQGEIREICPFRRKKGPNRKKRKKGIAKSRNLCYSICVRRYTKNGQIEKRIIRNKEE